MAVVSKTDRHGVDNAIEALQQSLFPRLIAYWDVNAVYTSYPRANKNYRDDDILPEISLDKKEYKEVLANDKTGVNSFWLVSNSRPYDADNKQLIHDVSLIFQADLVKLYGQTNRADEEFNIDVLRELTRKNVFMFNENITVITTVDAVYSDLTFSAEMKEKIIYTDISNLHVVRFDFEIRYSIDCIPTLAPICAGASETFNGNAISPLANASTKDIIVQTDAGGTPQVGTILTDTPTSLVISVPQAGATLLNTSNLYLDGQITSYRTGDNVGFGRGVDWWNLDIVDLPNGNGFGNLKRFTGTTGGYQDELDLMYYDLDAVSTTEALAFPDQIMLDWSQLDGVRERVFGINMNVNSAVVWNTFIDNVAGLSYAGFDDWIPMNKNVICIMTNDELIGGIPMLFDYVPISYLIDGQAKRLWTKTTGGITSRAFHLVENGGIQNVNKINTASYIDCRIFTYADLGL